MQPLPPAPPLAQPPQDGMGAPSATPGVHGIPGVPAPAVPPRPMPGEPRPPSPPVIAEQAKLARRLPPEEIKNPFERTAAMIDAAASDYAKRLAQHLSEQAADTMEADPQTVHEMMSFSRYGTDAPRVFWQVHDRILDEAVRAGDPDPYAAAERGALDEVYPYRAKLALLDVLGPEERVTRAELLSRMSHARMARGEVPEAMPFLVGPAGLPAPQEAPKPEQSSGNGRQNGASY